MIQRLWTQRITDPVFLYQGYQVIRYLVSVCTSVILVKSALPQSDLGFLEMMIFIVVSLSAFWSAGLNNAVFSLYSSLSEDKKIILPAHYVLVMVLFSGLLSLSVYILSPQVLRLFTGLGDMPGWFYVPLYIFFSVPLLTIEGLLFLKKKSSTLLSYTLWSQGGWLLVISVVALWQPDIHTFILAHIVWALIRWVYMWYVGTEGKGFVPDVSLILNLCRYSWPLVLTLAAGYGMDTIDGLFVSHFYDAGYFPVFRYGAREMPLSALLLSSLSVAMIPGLMQNSLQSREIYERATRLMHILYPVSFVLMVLSPWIFPLLYSEAYTDSAYIFNIYLLILASRILLPQTYTMALQKHKVVLLSGVLELILNVILSFAFMSLWGVYGLALATVLAYFFQKIFLLLYNKHYLGIPYFSYINWRYYVGYNVLLLAFFGLSFYLKS
jgi:O-antigen/teichoic acid export membrane protein